MVLLYAWTNGFTDAYPELEIPRYEQEMLTYMEKFHADVLTAIREKKEIDATTEGSLKKALTQFKEIFK